MVVVPGLLVETFSGVADDFVTTIIVTRELNNGKVSLIKVIIIQLQAIFIHKVECGLRWR